MSNYNSSVWNSPGSSSGAATPMSVTGTQLIYGALRLLGVLRPGNGANPDSVADGLFWLNNLIDQWNTERLTAWAVRRDEYALTIGQQSYSIGPGGDLDADTPIRVERATLVIPGSTNIIEIPLEPLNVDQWAGIQVKGVSSLPRQVYVEMSYPLVTVNLWPIPQLAYTLVLYTLQTISQFADTETQYAFPPGYAMALMYNLAAAMAPAFIGQAKINRPLIEMISNQAIKYKSNLMAKNVPEQLLVADGALISDRGFNWLTGDK